METNLLGELVMADVVIHNEVTKTSTANTVGKAKPQVPIQYVYIHRVATTTMTKKDIQMKYFGNNIAD